MPPTVDITRVLSDFIAGLAYADLPADVVEQTRKFMADYCAAAIAGYRVNTKFNTALLSTLRENGGAEQSTVLLERRRYPAPDAAFMNAAYAHGADMDDGNRKAAGHIGAHVLSAVFAVAEKTGALWRDVFVAANAGYEVFNRVVGSAMPGLYNKGFHSTGVGGAMACAAACAKLMGMDAGGIYNALSLAAIQSGGLIIIDESGQGCKPINPANAARLGVLSAQIAMSGVEAPRNPLQSGKGWYNAFGAEIDLSAVTQGLGRRFTIMESYLKIYPSCRHTHCAMEAALALRAQLSSRGLGAESVRGLRLFVYPAAFKSTGGIRYPKNADEAKFSIAYCLAVALIRGGFGLDALTPAITEDMRRVLDSVSVIVDPSLEDRDRGVRGARLEATLTGGEALSNTVLIPKGEAAQPLSWADIADKTRFCAGGLFSDAQVEALLRAVRQADIRAVFRHPMLALGAACTNSARG